MKRTILALLITTLAAAGPAAVHAKQESVAGTWTMTVEQRFGLKLVLEEKKSLVSGTLDWPHGDPIKLTGLAAEDRVVFSGESTGENFTIHIDSTATRKPDGTMAGTVHAHFDEFNDAHEVVRVRNQEIPWTAVRGLHDIVHFGR